MEAAAPAMLAPSFLGRRQHGWRPPPATSVHAYNAVFSFLFTFFNKKKEKWKDELRHRRPRHRVRQPGLGEDPRARRRHFPRRPRCARRRPHSLGTTISWPQQRSIYGENARDGTPTNPCAPGSVPGGSSSGSAVAVAVAANLANPGVVLRAMLAKKEELAAAGNIGSDPYKRRRIGADIGHVALAFVAASLGKGGWRGGGGGRWVAALFRRGSVERSSLQRVFGDATLRDTVAPLLRLPPPRRLRRDVRRRGHRHSRPLRRRAHGHRRGVGRGGGHGQPHRRRHHPSPPQQVGVPPRRRRRRPPRRLHRLRLLLQRRPFRHPVLQGPVAGVVGEADTEVAAAQEVAVEVAGHPVVASSRRMARQGEAGHTVDPAAEEEEDAGHRAAAGSGRGGGGAEEDADDHHARRPPRARKEK
uniref:Expressed protein n=2 Tax=Oryza sativa subsp. japonica TaxID=39947 RepID=Q75IV8_ORYSJ|nr:hypothetical protein [Oryza sativa Japonica Group]ABF96622.1 expressed protein [Oryza sativa Japonica Group]